VFRQSSGLFNQSGLLSSRSFAEPEETKAAIEKVSRRTGNGDNPFGEEILMEKGIQKRYDGRNI
jgi:hypothetical protein